MDPFVLLDQAEQRGTIPKSIAKRAHAKAPSLSGAVRRVEAATGLQYPPFYIEPALPVSKTGAEFGQMGVLFARVIPATVTGNLSIIVQFTAALLVFGSKGTIEAVTAHEFTHYVDLVRRLSRANVLTDERSTTLFESTYSDMEKTVPARLLFINDKALVKLVDRKFKSGLVDERLNKQVADKWIAKDLPMRMVPPEENVIRIGMVSVLNAAFDGKVLQRIAQLEEKKMTGS
jgi:hypothetical protein